MTKRSKILFIATALSTIYTVYLFSYFFGTTTSSEGAEAVGSAIATALVMPHAITFLVGAVFGWIGYLAKATWSALVAAILYAVATLLFLAYFMFGVPILVLGFVGYAKQKKLNKNTPTEI